jgi:hypothetical protein
MPQPAFPRPVPHPVVTRNEFGGVPHPVGSPPNLHQGPPMPMRAPPQPMRAPPAAHPQARGAPRAPGGGAGAWVR